VARSADEAERQSRGEDVTLIRDELPEIETYSEDAEDAAVAPGLGDQPDV
jgi:large subunit ribosomal protein L9